MNRAVTRVILASIGGTVCAAVLAASDGQAPKSGSTGNGGSPAAADAGVDASAEESPALVPELLPAEGMRIAKMVMARGVNRTEKERVPVEPGTSFEADGRRIYVFLEVDNPGETEGTLSVSWLPPGGKREIGKVSVGVKASKRWRTWSFNRYISTPGIWHAVVRNPEGEVIARAPFEMRAAQSAGSRSQ